MKNKIIAILLTAGMCVSMASCASTESSSDTASTTSLTSEESTSASATGADTNVTKTQYPLTLEVYNVDGNLVTETYTEAPTKVVPYTPAAVYTLLELSLGDTIVGIMKPDNDPPAELAEEFEKLNVIGDKTTVSKEAIIALEPDLMFGRVMSLSDDSLGTVESFNEMGIPVYTQKASSFAIDQSLDNIFEDIENIGKIFDMQDKAQEYISTLKTKLATVEEEVQVDKTEEPLTAILMVRYDDGNFSAFGSNSTLQNAALSKLNMVNAVEGTAGQLTNENLVALNPDVIIYVTADRNAEFDATARTEILESTTHSDVSAVKSQNYVEVPYESLMDYGPSIFDGIEMIYEGIYVK